MGGTVYRVPGLSAAMVKSRADTFRDLMGLVDEPSFPVMEVLEDVLDNRLGLVRFEVWEDRHLHGAEGLNMKDADGTDRIILAESVYIAGVEGDGRARFTAAHELGHWWMHSQVTLTRARQEELRAWENSEWQANTFAANLLMPTKYIYSDDAVDDLCARFGVSFQAASNRVHGLKKNNFTLKKKPPRLGGGS